MTGPDDAAPAEQDAKPFLEHLEDLRLMLLKCAAAMAAGLFIALPLAPRLFELLRRPLRAVTDRPDQFLRSLEVGGAFSVTMRIAMWAGFIISAPFVFFFVGQFVFPGLKLGERRLVVRAGALAVLLFVFGVVLGYWITLPAALNVMFGMHAWLGISAEWTVTSYVAFASQLLIGFGLAFELPALLLVAARLGLVSHRQLEFARPYAIVAALIIAALLTPPDVVSQLIMGIPLIALYELCVWVTWAGERKAKGAAAGRDARPYP